MKTKTKRYFLWGCGGCGSITIITLVLVIGFIYYLNKDYDIAKNPTKIASEAGFSLPPYDVISQEDNMDRGTSAWSSYHWELKLKEPLSNNQVKELDNLVKKDELWKYDQETRAYIYYRDGWDSESPSIHIVVHINGKVNMSYDWYDWLS